MDKSICIDNILSKVNLDNINKEKLRNYLIDNYSQVFKDIKFNEEIIVVFNKYFENKISHEGIIYFMNKVLELSIEECKKIINCIGSKSYFEHMHITGDLVTIIITTYNRKEMLEEAINSIKSQTYKNIEIIIIDDCSTDGSEKYIKDKFSNDENITYYRNKINKGPGISRSIAFNNFSNGKYIIFMDDDDFFIDNTYISKAVEIHEKNKKLSFVAAETFVENIDKNTLYISSLKRSGNINRKEYFMEFQTNKFPKPNSTFTALFNKSKLEKAGLKEVKMVNDSSIYLRSLLVGDAFLLNNVVGVYRLHGNNITFSCSSDFIIKNLQEKFDIGLIAQEKFDYSKDIIEEWFLRQIYITIFYYLYNSPTTIHDFIKILKFIKDKSRKNYRRIRGEVYKIYIRKLMNRIKK